jgi:predicted O-methyltransferase YrrM
VVEIGSWLGKSSVVLAKALADRPGAKLYCIDPFNAEGDAESRANYTARSAGLDETLEERFRSNLRRNGVGGSVIVRRGYSHEFAGAHAEPIDLLFIDGNHEHAAVERDYLDWSPHVRPGGWLCFHDVGRSAAPGPLRVIQDRVLGKPEWGEASQVNSLFCTRKAPLAAQAGARARRAP